MPIKRKNLKQFTGQPDLTFQPSDQRKYPWLKHETRHYVVQKLLDEGGAYGTTYLGYAVMPKGSPHTEAAQNLVIKVPNIDPPSRRRPRESAGRLEKIEHKAFLEFNHIKRRLESYPFANPIIDLAVDSTSGFFQPVTIQPFVSEKWVLDKWAKEVGLREHEAIRKNRQLEDNWTGIPKLHDWLETVLRIAWSLEGLHRRRVIHGDIHPGNVMLGRGHGQATLIDFGESMLCYPDRNRDKKRPENPYLAPERAETKGPIYEWVDVYSFGILMLYLATGKETRLTGQNYPGRLRSHIYELISARNQGLIMDEPRILDIIGKCTASDSADRPRMINVCEDLEMIVHSRAIRPSAPKPLKTVLSRIAKGLEPDKRDRNPILSILLHKKVSELQETVNSLETEMVEFFGTREQLLRTLVTIFDHLGKGDSWTTITTLGVWQRGALGTDGSYSSAMVRALKRGAAVRRTFVISVEEFGLARSKTLQKLLMSSSDLCLRKLGERFGREIERFKKGSVTQKFIQWHQERFLKVLATMQNLIDNWSLANLLCTDKEIDVRTSSKLYFGICPVATLDEANDLREDNPASLLHLPKERNDARKWLLVMTIVQRRCEDRSGINLPHLVGVRVFESRMGVPDDRIRELEHTMNQDSVNVVSSIKELLKLARSAFPKAGLNQAAP